MQGKYYAHAAREEIIWTLRINLWNSILLAKLHEY